MSNDLKQRRTVSGTVSSSSDYDNIDVMPSSKTAVASNSNNSALSNVYKPTKTPKETLHALYKVAQCKASLPMNILIVQSVMAGIYVAMAGQLFLAVGGGFMGAALFPVGLVAVVLTSAELFTGDTLVFMAAILGGQVGVDKMIRNWCVSWVFNFFGCIVWASIITYASDALEDSGTTEVAIKLSEKKALQPFGHIFLKAIGANFMVCLALWQATCAEDVAGKIMAIWFPISGFVLMGLEHIIANQYLIPVGMMYAGSTGKVTVGNLLCALTACTMGNIIGGGLLMGAVYWYINDSMNTPENGGNHDRNNGNGSFATAATAATSPSDQLPFLVRLRQAVLAFGSAEEPPPSTSTPPYNGNNNNNTPTGGRPPKDEEEGDDETQPIISNGQMNGGVQKSAVSTVDRVV